MVSNLQGVLKATFPKSALVTYIYIQFMFFSTGHVFTEWIAPEHTGSHLDPV